jgi:hypothetical protein
MNAVSDGAAGAAALVGVTHRTSWLEKRVVHLQVEPRHVSKTVMLSGLVSVVPVPSINVSSCNIEPFSCHNTSGLLAQVVNYFGRSVSPA